MAIGLGGEVFGFFHFLRLEALDFLVDELTPRINAFVGK
jgi:hypothetical protein